MRGEDTHDALLRRLTEHRSGLVERIASGNAPVDNAPGGYMHIAGQVVGIDAAIALIREVLFGERPEEPERRIYDRYM